MPVRDPRGMTFASSAFPHPGRSNTMNDHKARLNDHASALRAGALGLLCAALAGGCATVPDTDAEPAALVQARETYVGCVNAEAEKEASGAAGAEDIALAAHGRCWTS